MKQDTRESIGRIVVAIFLILLMVGVILMVLK